MDSEIAGIIVVIGGIFMGIVGITAATMFEDWTEMRKYEMCVTKSPDPVKCNEKGK